MTKNPEYRRALDTLQMRLRTILPDKYSGEDVQPMSMGSAGLKFRSDGTVAWDAIWATFCHLAMAGGPPHKGTLLEPGSQIAIHKNPGRHLQVVDEICRGINLVTGLDAERSEADGWVRVDTPGSGMAGWLARAINMENVSARCEGAVLQLPAGPDYRLEKEIKNVITVIAKTCHYWRDHMCWPRHRAIGDLLVEMEMESPLIQPALAGYEFQLDLHQALFDKIADSIHRTTDLKVSHHRYAGWLGVHFQSVGAAIWMMRAMVISNVLSRREGTVLFVPVNPIADPNGETVLRILAQVRDLAASKRIL